MIRILVFFLLFALTSCGNKERRFRERLEHSTARATGYIASLEGRPPPRVIGFDQTKLKKVRAGLPKVVPTNLNVRLAGKPKIVQAAPPAVRQPGKAPFSLPLVVPAVDSSFVAGTPAMFIAKDKVNKDHNPKNFSTYGKLQGLQNGSISCMLQDRSGNLWFGTWGGASKFDGKSFTSYSKKEGLSSNFIRSILQDQSGKLWFGTNNGVSRFDGKFITNYSEKEGLANNVVNCMLQDRNGNLWLGTDGGISKFDGKFFTNYSEKEGLAGNVVHCILQDSSGNIWMGTNGGLSRYNGVSFTNYSVKEGLAGNVVFSLLQDKDGYFWLGTNGGVIRFDGKFFTSYSVNEGLISNVVHSLLQDKSGKLWFGTNAGVSKFDGKHFTNYNDKEGLANNEVKSLLQDQSGNLWFGTNDGVSKFDGQSFTNYGEEEGLCNNFVWNILKDQSGNIWFATWGGVTRFDGKSFTSYSEKEGLASNVVWSMLQDKSGIFWFGTAAGVNRFDGTYFTLLTEKEGLPSKVVNSMLQDDSGNIWFGTDNGVSRFNGTSFTVFGIKQGLVNSVVNCMLQDRKGNLWFGTEGGLSKFDGKTFTNYTERDGLASNITWSILEDGNENLWLGTIGGLSKFNGTSFTNYSEKEGLVNNVVTSMLMDKRGSLWFGTRFGLSKLKERSLPVIPEAEGSPVAYWDGEAIFENYTYSDGFLGIGVNGGRTMLQDENGDIWIGANNRLMVYHPPVNEIQDTSGPVIQLTGLSLFNEEINWLALENRRDSVITLGNGMKILDFHFDSITNWYYIPENLSLAHNNNYLTFRFIGITSRQPEKVKYQYKLEGNDENWSTFGFRTEANYSNLAPGDYFFRVKAINSSGYRSKEFRYPFTIRPPWWKTWWAYTSYVLLLVLSIVSYIRWREHALKARQKELEQKVDDATVEIRKEKERSEELLLNILPSEVAEELKQKGYCEAKLFNAVTVLFTDFKNFTLISEKLSPNELVNEINLCYSAFDSIISRYVIEKIKTIGDSYMCASGIPVGNTAHAVDVIHAAFEMLDFMNRIKEKRREEGKPFFEIRIGCHTGPVVAGIVGIKKFAYDIWGDTVNIASRMESSGEEGKINISGTTYSLVKDKFHCIHRGKIEVKNKGGIDMYFVEGAA